jgi:hypothetical protein
MPQTLHTVVTVKAGCTVMIVVLAGAVHVLNGSPSGHHPRTVQDYFTRIPPVSSTNFGACTNFGAASLTMKAAPFSARLFCLSTLHR